MKEFRRSIPWMDDDASGFGDCYGNYETQVIAGNTFDYPAVHGAAILKAGYSFVSCSDEAVENGQVVLNDYTYRPYSRQRVPDQDRQRRNKAFGVQDIQQTDARLYYSLL